MYDYDGYSKEELLDMLEQLKLEKSMLKKQISQLRDEVDAIMSEKPRYEKAWDDPRCRRRLSKIAKLSVIYTYSIPQRRNRIKHELDNISAAKRGGCERVELTKVYYDENMYVREIECFGYVKGISL